MFKNRECPECKAKVDDALDTCPQCGHVFFKKNDKVTYLRFWKQLVLFGIGSLGFQIAGVVVSLIGAIIAQFYFKSTTEYEAFLNSVTMSAIVNFTAYGLVAIAAGFVLFRDIKPLAKSFRSWKVPVSAVVGFAAIFAFGILYSVILKACGIELDNNKNEQAIRQIVAMSPVLSLLIFAILGPIVEEITYRVGLYSFFRRINKYLAFVLTIIVFAFIHFDFATTNLTNELLNLPTYFFAAFVLTLLYEKFGFGASTTCHVINNLVSIISTIVLVFNK